MLKHLLTALTILITLIIIPQPVFAATQPTAPQAPTYEKKFMGFWQKMTLRNLLKQESNETTTIVKQPSPTDSPTPNLRRTPTTKVASPTPTRRLVTPTPTKKPSAPTPTKKPVTPTPTKTQTPTAVPTKVQPVSQAPTNDVTAFIMGEINAYRSSQGLSSVQTSAETCNFAKVRAQEISTNFSHDGFNERKNNNSLPYADWSAITENIAMTSNYKDVVTMWKNSSGHAANMRANTPYVCVMQHGNYYAYEGMKL